MASIFRAEEEAKKETSKSRRQVMTTSKDSFTNVIIIFSVVL
jgi:hypothetical protein